MEKPKCPNHPTSPVLKARVVGKDNGIWVCLHGGCNLGDAGPASPPGWEQFEVLSEDKAKR